MSFVDFGFSASLLRAIEAAGYTDATPIQSQAIPHLLAGKDLLGCAQTGTGKTAAFALPILNRFAGQPVVRDMRGTIRVLVLSPTRELALQISDSFKKYGRFSQAAVAVIYGGVNQDKQVQSIRRGASIAVATPGRLRDLIGQGLVRLDQVDVLVLDESDRMLDMGFLPDVKFIINRLPTKRQTILFSATISQEIETLAASIMTDPVRLQVAARNTTAERVRHSVCFVPKDKKVSVLGKLLQEPEVQRAIVFSRTKHGADRIARHLEKLGISTAALHGNKSQNTRQRILTSFKANQIQVLVATDIAARGIDVDGISHVFNYDLPMEPETYVHRIGRTARAGAEGIAISFCAPDERNLLREIERLLRKSIPVDQHGFAPADMRQGESHSRGGSPGRGPQPGTGQQGQRRRTLSGKIRPARTDTRPNFSFGKSRRGRKLAAR